MGRGAGPPHRRAVWDWYGVKRLRGGAAWLWAGVQHATALGARCGAALGRCPELCWDAAAAQGAQHVAAPGRGVGPSKGVVSARAGAWHAAAKGRSLGLG